MILTWMSVVPHMTLPTTYQSLVRVISPEALLITPWKQIPILSIIVALTIFMEMYVTPMLMIGITVYLALVW